MSGPCIGRATRHKEAKQDNVGGRVKMDSLEQLVTCISDQSSPLGWSSPLEVAEFVSHNRTRGENLQNIGADGRGESCEP